MVEIYEYHNHIMIYSDCLEPVPHKHVAAHVFLSENPMLIRAGDNEFYEKGIVIPTGVEHAIEKEGHPVLVFLFDETTSAAECITSVSKLSEAMVDELLHKFSVYKNNGQKVQDYIDFVQDLYKNIGVDELPKEIKDERIRTALYYINQRIGDKVICKEVADAVFMSESRFSHLFKEVMGITFLGFLQMRKLSYAYYLIINGLSVTEAALTAGFSSSAHFAASHKRIFGLCTTDVTSDLKFCKIE